MEANDTSDGHFMIGMHNASTYEVRYGGGESAIYTTYYVVCIHFGVEASDFSAEDRAL